MVSRCICSAYSALCACAGVNHAMCVHVLACLASCVGARTLCGSFFGPTNLSACNAPSAVYAQTACAARAKNTPRIAIFIVFANPNKAAKIRHVARRPGLANLNKAAKIEKKSPGVKRYVAVL